MAKATLAKQSLSDFMNDNMYHYPEQCPFCGVDLIAFKDEYGHPRSSGVCPSCGYPYEKDADKRIVELTQKSQKSDAFNYVWNAGIYPSMDIFNHKYSNFNANDIGRKGVLNQSKDVCKRIASGEIVHSVLLGGTGTGKTHIAVSMLYEILELTKYRFKICFVDYRELLSQRKKSFNDKTKAIAVDRTITEIKRADVAIIDDLGSESKRGASNTEATAFNTDTATEIMSARESKTTLITTNLSGAELKEMYGQPVLSRIRNYSKGNNILFANLSDYRSN